MFSDLFYLFRRYYSYFIVSSEVAFKILNFIYHTFPACLMDLAAKLTGKRTIYYKISKKTEKILVMMSYFGRREWNFGNKNIEALVIKTKTLKFVGNFDFDMRNIDWNYFFRNYVPGIKRYFFKENCENIKKLEASYQRYLNGNAKRRLVNYSISFF